MKLFNPPDPARGTVFIGPPAIRLQPDDPAFDRWKH
jgi:hypothetical protein